MASSLVDATTQVVAGEAACTETAKDISAVFILDRAAERAGADDSEATANEVEAAKEAATAAWRAMLDKIRTWWTQELTDALGSLGFLYESTKGRQHDYLEPIFPHLCEEDITDNDLQAYAFCCWAYS